MKTQIIEEAREAAQKEAQKVMDAAKVSIEQSRKEAEQNFRNEVSAFALDIASKVVRNQLADEKAQTKLVNTLLDEIEKQN
jgi:F-type H+-transporting ATPase subunit b